MCILHLCSFKTPTLWAVMSEEGDADCAFSMRNGVKWHACHFILSKCYPFTDLKKALRAVSNLQWCKSARLRIYSFKVLPIYRFQTHILCELKSSMV